jgi:hypothetical protein
MFPVRAVVLQAVPATQSRVSRMLFSVKREPKAEG